jgi:hypothetical protein
VQLLLFLLCTFTLYTAAQTCEHQHSFAAHMVLISGVSFPRTLLAADVGLAA